MGDDKGKQPEDSTQVCKAPMKEAKFDLEHAQETFVEANKSFADASTSGRKDKPELEMNPSMLMVFLETCMKLPRDSRTIKMLQELINRRTGTVPSEPRVLHKIGKHKTSTGREMRLTAQIREYEMDQVILDLGSDVNFLPKQTWE